MPVHEPRIRLESDRLLFRDHLLEDLEPFCAMESDPLNRAPQRVHPRAEIERRFNEIWLPPKPMGLLATVFKADNRYIGRCGLYPVLDPAGNVVPGEARIAFYIARDYWGRGLATEAGRFFIKHGFETLGLHRIEAGVHAKNHASLRVIEKLGFKFIRSGGDAVTTYHDFELLPQGIR